jgi:hypothetical protein
MATTIEWKIAQLERTLADGVVYTLHYTVDAFDGTYRSSAYGSIGLEPPEEDALIPFADLTEEVVIGWLLDKLGEEQVRAVSDALQAQLDEQASPTKGTGLPWG